MICVYAPDATDFSTNGLGAVDPHVCTVTETLNGEWELTLEHMIDDAGKWARLAEGNILRAPVPASMTPRTATIGAPASSAEIWKITGGNVRLRAGAGTNHKRLKTYKLNDEMIVVDKSNPSWYECIAPDGKRGFMATSYLAYVRTETVAAAVAQVIEPKQMRDQPFRIYRIVPEMDKVKVYARHIFYDLLDNMIQSYKPTSSTTGAQVLAGIAGNCLSAHDFTFASDLAATAEDVELENVNPVEAILGAGGLVEKYGGELARDWYDVYVVERVGADAGVQVREGKNLLGISYDVDVTDVVTRIMPTGEDEDGKVLYLPELYIDSPNIGDSPKWVHLPVSEAIEVTKGDDKKTKEQCYTEMRAAAQAEYEKSCDLPTVTLKVDFINCADTEEYKQYAALQNIYIGDGVRVLARRVGVAVTMRMTQYKFDCLTRKYTDMTLGAVADTIEGNVITVRQLPNGVISGAKLAINSVGAGQIKNGAVGSLQIGLAAIQAAHIGQAVIGNAHIGQAAIGTANIQDLAVTNAKIAALAVDTANIKNLAVTAAKIADAAITNAKIGTAAIKTANIENAAIETAKIADAAITNAKIGTAAVWTANIKDAAIGTAKIALGAITTALIEAGAIGTAQIADASITDAKVVDLSANRITAGVLSVERLIIAGSDKSLVFAVNNMGDLVSTSVDTIDAYALTERTITADKIVAGAITANELAAASVIANKIAAGAVETDKLAAYAVTAGKIKAGAIETGHISAGAIETVKLAANAVTAGKIKAGAIETGHISAGAWDALMLDAQERITLAVGGVRVGGVNLLRNTSFRSGFENWVRHQGEFIVISSSPDLSHNGRPSVRIDVSGQTENQHAQFHQTLAAGDGWRPGDTVTLSAMVRRAGELDQGAQLAVSTYDGTTWDRHVAALINAETVPAGWAYTHVAGQPIKIPAGTTQIRANCSLIRNGIVNFADVKLEIGNKATAWTTHAEEFEAGTSIELRENRIKMVSEEMRFAVPLETGSDETKLLIDEGGVSAASMRADDVMPRYNGPAAITINPAGTPSDTVYTSLSDFLTEINGTMLTKIVTVTVAAGAVLNEDLQIAYIMGGGMLRIYGASEASKFTLNGSITISGVSGVEFRDMIVNARFASGAGYMVNINRVQYFSLERCILNGNTYTGRGVSVGQGSSGYVNTCEFYNSASGLVAGFSSQVTAYNCVGAGFSTEALRSAGVLFCAGTIPVGVQSKVWNGVLDTTNCTAHSGSAAPPPSAQTTQTYTATLTGWHQNGWSSESQMRQGYTTAGGAGITGGMWFNNTIIRADLSGKTIKAATLRLYRKPSGRSSAIEVYLYGTSDANKGGNQVRTKSYGKLGTIARSTGKAFAIPTAAITDLRAGTINGLYLWTGETTARSTGYSDNYGTFGGTGDGADRIPQLTVTYE